MNHRRKKKKNPIHVEKVPNRVERIGKEEKPKDEQSNKFVDILLGILLFPIIIWAVLEGSRRQLSKKATLVVISVIVFILVGVVIIGNK
ncbi:hypothetical protein [Bacillus sp. LK2]|uniref:hypothetical protein n=1 Tax=Bacillus sp. LK2 TaxID=1628206 RepID=UPI00065415B0|nr:hypothetical protein [Bacillus sp. LK2]KMN42511.1 hypothetical protein VK90_23930 [Bacillus sp. LK2]